MSSSLYGGTFIIANARTPARCAMSPRSISSPLRGGGTPKHTPNSPPSSETEAQTDRAVTIDKVLHGAYVSILFCFVAGCVRCCLSKVILDFVCVLFFTWGMCRCRYKIGSNARQQEEVEDVCKNIVSLQFGPANPQTSDL